jgi:hypothetical protein
VVRNWGTTAPTKTNKPEHIARGSKETDDAKIHKELSTSNDSFKYMKEVEAWFDATIQRGEEEDDSQYRKRVLTAIKSRLVESYKNGQRSMAA